MKRKNFICSCIVVTMISFFGLTNSSLAWQLVPGAATDITISSEGIVYALGKKRTAGGYNIFQWANNGWAKMTGGGVSIAAGAKGTLWVVDDRSKIFRYINNGWQQLPGLAADVAAGADGSVYIIGRTDCGSGGEIFSLVGSNGWSKQTGCGVQIEVAPEGTPWVIDRRGKLYNFTSGGWIELPGSVTDIAVGKNGDAWAIGTTVCPGGRNILHYVNNDWTKVDGCGVNIEVAPNNEVWVINNQGKIYKR